MPTIEWVPQGRTATLVCTDGNRVAELFVEMSGVPQYDGLVHLEDLAKWVTPSGEKISKQDEDRLLRAILDWEAGVRIKLDIPSSIRSRLKD